MKTKALISFAVTAKLICVFVFAYADCWFSHEAAHLNHCLFYFNDPEKADGTYFSVLYSTDVGFMWSCMVEEIVEPGKVVPVAER